MKIHLFFDYRKSGENGVDEWGIIELQGDLEVRDDEIINGEYIGNLNYDKHGQPVNKTTENEEYECKLSHELYQILIVGHHILHGKEQRIEKPFAVLRKTTNVKSNIENENESEENELNQTVDRTILDSTVAIEHKSTTSSEYIVVAVVKKKLLFKTRPKPIIANAPKKI